MRVRGTETPPRPREGRCPHPRPLPKERGSKSPAERSEGPIPSRAKQRPVRCPNPLWLRRGAQRFADQGSQLFERSEFCETPRNASTAGCPQRSGGTQTVGSPFLCLLSFGEAKESKSAAGRNSRPREKRESPALIPHPQETKRRTANPEATLSPTSEPRLLNQASPSKAKPPPAATPATGHQRKAHQQQ